MTQYEIKEIPETEKNKDTLIAVGTRKLVSLHCTKSNSGGSLTLYADEHEPTTDAQPRRFELSSPSATITLEVKDGSQLEEIQLVDTLSSSISITSSATWAAIHLPSTMSISGFRSAVATILAGATSRDKTFFETNFVITSGQLFDLPASGSNTVLTKAFYRVRPARVASVPVISIRSDTVFSILDIHKRFEGGMWAKASDHDAAYLVVYS